MLYCLDTNIVVDFFQNEKEIVQKMSELEQQQVTIVCTPIILCELYKGAYLGSRQKERLDLVDAFLKRARILEFTEYAGNIFGQRYAELQKQGKQTQEFDLMIASICIAHNAILVTRNRKDFANIKDLKIVAW